MLLLVYRVTEHLLPTWLLMAVVACLPLLVQTNQPRYGMLRAASALTPSRATGGTPFKLVIHLPPPPLPCMSCHPADAQDLLKFSRTAAMEAVLKAIPLPACPMFDTVCFACLQASKTV